MKLLSIGSKFPIRKSAVAITGLCCFALAAMSLYTTGYSPSPKGSYAMDLAPYVSGNSRVDGAYVVAQVSCRSNCVESDEQGP